MMNVSRHLHFEDENYTKDQRYRKKSIYSSDDNILSYPDLSASILACDSSGLLAALAGNKCLAIVSLTTSETLEYFQVKNNKKEILAIQWSPFSSSFLSAYSNIVELWNWDHSGKVVGKLTNHTRNICDLDWSTTQENLVATCALDNFTYIWDMRDYRKPIKSLQSVVSAFRVKWNKLSEGMLATSQEGDLRIWDIRKCTTPVESLTGHKDKVISLDWSPVNERYLLSSSQDGSLKFWDISKPKNELDAIKNDIGKAKYLPNYSDLATVVYSHLASRGDSNIYLFNLDLSVNHATNKQPIKTLFGHTSTVLDFAYKRNEKGDIQLVSWSRDLSLRIWKIESSIKQNPRMVFPTKDMAFPNSVEDQMSNSPIPRSSSMVQVNSNHPMPETLENEYEILNQNLPHVQFEDINFETRELLVNASNEQNCIHLLFKFPELYPNKTAPKFTLLSDSTIKDKLAEKLIKDLEDTAYQHVNFSRCCIEPCLRRLTHHLKEVEMEKAAEMRESQNRPYLSCQEENIPFPRISGARFCGPGYLVCFTRRMLLDIPNQEIARKKLTSECDVTPRAMSALLDIKPATIRSSANVLRSSVGLARSLPNDSNVPSVFEYYQIKDQKPNTLKSMPKFITVSLNMKANLGPVIIYDLSSLLPVQKTLGENYVFENDLTSMCRNNVKVAIQHDRKDLAHLWSLAEVQVAAFQNSLKQNDHSKDMPWSIHPFANKLIKTWYNYYGLVKDVQTLAMLSCLFTCQLIKQCKPTASLSTFYSFKAAHDVTSTLQNQDDFEDTDLNIIPNLVKRQRSNSCSEIWCDSFDQLNTPDISNEEDMANMPRFLDEEIEAKHDLFIRCYASMLFQWGFYYKRAQLLKFLINPVNPSATLTQKEKLSAQKKLLTKKCILCRLPVFGLSTNCLSCGHGGHIDHLSNWFANHLECPVPACPCSCLVLNNYNS